VAPERDAVQKVADEPNHLLGRSQNFVIDVYRWETDSGPGFHADGPQGKIDEDLPIADCDIIVAIFWTRFGSTILAGSETGTEHEINLAFEAWKKSKRKPQILIYFKTEAPDWDRIDGAQIARVKDFKKEFQPGGKYQQGQCDTFVTTEEFKEKLRRHLPQHLAKGRRSVAPSSGKFDFGG